MRIKVGVFAQAALGSEPERLEFDSPGLAVGAHQHLAGLGVAGDLLLVGVPVEVDVGLGLEVAGVDPADRAEVWTNARREIRFFFRLGGLLIGSVS
jgi:hypothetical protein